MLHIFMSLRSRRGLKGRENCDKKKSFFIAFFPFALLHFSWAEEKKLMKSFFSFNLELIWISIRTLILALPLSPEWRCWQKRKWAWSFSYPLQFIASSPFVIGARLHASSSLCSSSPQTRKTFFLPNELDQDLSQPTWIISKSLVTWIMQTIPIRGEKLCKPIGENIIQRNLFCVKPLEAWITFWLHLGMLYINRFPHSNIEFFPINTNLQSFYF